MRRSRFQAISNNRILAEFCSLHFVLVVLGYSLPNTDIESMLQASILASILHAKTVKYRYAPSVTLLRAGFCSPVRGNGGRGKGQQNLLTE